MQLARPVLRVSRGGRDLQPGPLAVVRRPTQSTSLASSGMLCARLTAAASTSANPKASAWIPL
jgi:hypothetical protein